tara:strand:+ start:36194 stop:36412 length:219 start_codon:yes stop_codon:yes gene_type:complete
MKTILISILFIFIGVTAQAQDAEKEVKVETAKMTIVTFSKYSTSTARLYKYKNSRIKKALDFTTKSNKAKLA